MSFISTLTWRCIELQGFLESPDVSQEDKSDLILKHLNSLEECSRDVFPEFESGWEWFNTKRSLTVNTDFKDQIVVVDFFTYCCINCMHILPDLHDLEDKYPNDQSGVVVVGVHSAKFENEKVSANIMAAIQRYGIHHPVVNDSEAVLWKQLEITCWPTLLILGPDSKPLFVIIGEGHRDVLFRYVDKTLTYFKSQITPRPLPLLLDNLGAFQSHLLFPGKICLLQYESLDGSTQNLAVSDTGHHRILIISSEGEIKATIGGPTPGFEDGPYDSARFSNPQGMAFLPPYSLYVADTGNHSVRLVNLSSKEVQTVAGTGIQGTDKEGGKPGKEQSLASPWDLCLARSSTSENNDLLIIANAGTHQIWGLALRDLVWWKKLEIQAGQCFRLAGSGAEENRNNSYPAKAAFAQPSGLCCATLQSDNLIFVADSESSSIRQINLKDGCVKGLVGGDKDPMNLFRFGDLDNTTDPKGHVLLQHPLGVAWNPANQLLYVADSYNHKIKSLDPLKKVCSTYLGSGKAGLGDGTLGEDDIKFNEPGGLCVDVERNLLYVADTNNHCIRRIDLLRNITETLKINVKPIQKSEITNTQPDFEVLASLPSGTLVNWVVNFKCSDQWKWSEDAPHSWKIKSSEGLDVSENKGKVYEGEMTIKVKPQLMPENDGGNHYLDVQTELFLCAIGSGLCTKKSIAIRLNAKTDKNAHGDGNSQIHHEFRVDAN